MAGYATLSRPTDSIGLMQMEENEVSEHGRFWLSGTPIEEPRIVPADTASGMLKIDADGKITLKLGDPLLTAPVSKDTVILGYLPFSARFVRLEQIEAMHPSIIARYCLIGDRQSAGTTPIEDIADIQIPMEGFESWLGVPWHKYEETERGEGVLKSAPPEHWTYQLNSIEFDLAIRFGWRVTGQTASSTLTSFATLGLRPCASTTLREVADTICKLEDLALLLTDRDRSFDWPTVTRRDESDASRFYFCHRLNRRRSNIEHLHIWVTFPWIRDDFGRIVDNWFAKYREFPSTFINYLATRRASPLYLEHCFLSLIWAMEAMSRRSGRTNPNPGLVAKIQRIRKNVKQCLKSDDRGWLNDLLTRAEDPSLQDRMFEIVSSLPLGLNDEHVKEFAKRCASRRNELSHYGGQRPDDASGNADESFINDLGRLTRALDLLCHTRILREIGVPDEMLRRPFQSEPRRWFLDAAGLPLPETTSGTAKQSSGGAAG